MGRHRLDERQKTGSPVVVVRDAPTPDTPALNERATLLRRRSEEPKR